MTGGRARPRARRIAVAALAALLLAALASPAPPASATTAEAAAEKQKVKGKGKRKKGKKKKGKGREPETPATGPLSVPWPPAEGQPGHLFVHFGEEHVNDADGGTLLPKVVADSARYRPQLVLMSGDKVNDGEGGQLRRWSDVIATYDAAGVPWFAAVGNHDRNAPPGAPPGVLPIQDFSTYRWFFGTRPYPMGDSAPYPDPLISPRTRSPGDESGAATHYFVDYGPTRWIFIDNSCWSIIVCDTVGLKFDSGQSSQSESQFAFLRRVATQAQDQGRFAFVVMHMPTRDPRDQSYVDPTSTMHTMGKGVAGVLDNPTFERTAAESGVDGVFVAHIKGQFTYRGQGGVPYYIDGGAGGELYTTGPVGVDHGYWHGYRLVRVDGGTITTEIVPIFVDGGLRIEGPATLRHDGVGSYFGFGRQPVFKDPAKVEALELRDPDPVPKRGGLALGGLGAFGVWAVPPALILLLALLARWRAPARWVIPALFSFCVVATGAAGVSLAQQSTPTATPRQSLPEPARIWTISDPEILAPIASGDDDPRRNVATQTEDGRFRGRCPGTARLELASGWASAERAITVASDPSRPLVRKLVRRVARFRPGKKRTLATVKLGQPARVEAHVKLGRGRKVRLRSGCVIADKAAIRWNGKAGKAGKRRRVAPGKYSLVVKVLSDRKPRRFVRPVTVRR